MKSAQAKSNQSTEFDIYPVMRPFSKVEKALEQVELYGLLLKCDPRLPSVTTLVAGEPVPGSWWGHPMGRQIFHVLEALGDHHDITIVKLISGKDTFVHKRLFPHLVSIGTAREPWQMAGLSSAARDLYELVQKEGEVSTDNLELPGMKGSKEAARAARDLERVLLVHGQSVHTSSGKHTKQLESWERWADRTAVSDSIAAGDAIKKLEETMESLNRRFGAKGRLPWSRG